MPGTRPRRDATVAGHAPPASRRFRGCARGAKRCKRRRPDHAARRGAGRDAVHRPHGRQGHGDHELRRRGARHHGSPAARDRAHPHARVGSGGRRDRHRPRLLGLADLLPGGRRRPSQHRRHLRRHRPVRRQGRPRDADRADPRRAGPAALVGAAIGPALDRRRQLQPRRPADAVRPQPGARGDVRSRRAQGQLAARDVGRLAARRRLPAAAARAGRGGVRRPDVRRHSDRRDRHRRLRGRPERLALRPRARRRRPPLALPPRRLHPHGDRQPGRRARALDVQARLAGQRRRHGHQRHRQRRRRPARRAARQLSGQGLRQGSRHRARAQSHDADRQRGRRRAPGGPVDPRPSPVRPRSRRPRRRSSAARPRARPARCACRWRCASSRSRSASASTMRSTAAARTRSPAR